jgi:hypothetical protein
LTLPAHRFEERKKQAKGSRVWFFDFDGTITGAPDQMTRVASGLRTLGDTIIVLTGNASPRAALVKQLADYGFPYDELIQYQDDGTNGVDRAEYLKRFGAWGAFDNRIDRAPIFAEVCPHMYVIAAVADEAADTTKKAAKQAAKAFK